MGTNLGRIQATDANITKLINTGVFKLINRFVEGAHYVYETYQVVQDVEFVLIRPMMTIKNGRSIPGSSEQPMATGSVYNIEHDYS